MRSGAVGGRNVASVQLGAAHAGQGAPPPLLPPPLAASTRSARHAFTAPCLGPQLPQVVLKTTLGDLDIELWPKEAPKATRNFVQVRLQRRGGVLGGDVRSSNAAVTLLVAAQGLVCARCAERAVS